jgi:uncharacterized protein DUF6766
MTLKSRMYNNSLMLAMFGIFTVSIIGMSIAGWMSSNDDLLEHNQPKQAYGAYLQSGEFIEGVFENWESEFLQMWALTILTVYLRQKGSADSKPIRGATPQDTTPRYSLRRSASWLRRRRAIAHMVYSHSLGLALLLFFIISFMLHVLGGAAAYNQENTFHNSEQVTTIGYLMSSQFWYESLQNWQSEFLSIGVILVLSIKLRERGSPQSKPVGTRFDGETG